MPNCSYLIIAYKAACPGFQQTVHCCLQLIRTLKRMCDSKESYSTESCTACTKNTSLIKKYEELISLYKKKQLKLSVDGSSRLSNGPTTSNTLAISGFDIRHFKACQILCQLFKRRCRSFFRSPSSLEAKKIVLLVMANRISKHAKSLAWGKLIQILPDSKQPEVPGLSPECDRNPKPVQSFQQGTTKSAQSFVLENLAKNDDIVLKVQSELKNIKKDILCSQKTGNVQHLFRRITELQIENQKIKLENSILRTSLEQSAKRQAKQNQKKKESLEMLAEEISEKNQQIQQLKQTIKVYEATYQPNGNVLEDDVIQMRRDLDNLQGIKEKLNDDLQKVRGQLEEISRKLKAAQSYNQSLAAQNEELKKINYQSECLSETSEKAVKEYERLSRLLEAKIKRLGAYERQLSTGVTQDHKDYPTTIIDELKSQLILLYLANIHDPHYRLKSQKLFDEQEKAMLQEIKSKISHRPHKDCQPNLDELQVSEINIRQGVRDSSFYEVFEPARSTSHPSNAMKMLELELEKSKQVSKISELKEKLLHVRVIVLKLLKSLELQPALKQETEGILRVIFDLFEYSEEERDSIFPKKKKLFGFI